VDPRVDLDTVMYTKITYSCRESNPGHPARSPSLYRLSYSGSTDCDCIVVICLFVCLFACFCPVFVLLSLYIRTDSVTDSWILTSALK
jgi:hypothetical protein